MRRRAPFAGLNALFAGLLLAAAPVSSAPVPRPESDAGTAFVMKRLDTVMMARNFDGPSGDGFLCVNKRDVDKEPFGAAGATPLRWRSKYGSVTFNLFGPEFPLGGLNEAGLAIEEIGGPAAYPAADGRPALNELQWIQYQLDNHDSVKEVLKSDRNIRVAKLLFEVHYLVADRKGQIAVVEFVGGKMVAYQGEELRSPVLSGGGYAEAARSLSGYRWFGGEKRPSSGPGAAERFVRAATSLGEYGWLARRPSVDDAFVVLRAVARDDTQWSVAYNLPRRLVLFKTKANRRYRIVRLENFDFSCRTPSLWLPIGATGSRDLSGDFAAYDAGRNRAYLEGVFKKLVEAGGLPAAPPADLAGKLAAYPDSCLCGRGK